MKGGNDVFFDGNFNQKELEAYVSSAYKKFLSGTKFASLSNNEKAAVNQAANKDTRADEILKKK